MLKHEQEVTRSINDLMSLAIEDRDHATVNFLQWFVDEQVEEEANVSDILAQLKLVGGKEVVCLCWTVKQPNANLHCLQNKLITSKC